MKTLLSAFVFLCAFSICSAAETAQPPVVRQLTPHVWTVVAGFNGTITVCQTASGPVVVDTADAPSASSVRAAIRQIDPRPIAGVVLTHYHDDHTGGLGTIGAGTTVYATPACLAALRADRDQKGAAALAQAGRVVEVKADLVLPVEGGVIRLLCAGLNHPGRIRRDARCGRFPHEEGRRRLGLRRADEGERCHAGGSLNPAGDLGLVRPKADSVLRRCSLSAFLPGRISSKDVHGLSTKTAGGSP